MKKRDKRRGPKHTVEAAALVQWWFAFLRAAVKARGSKD